MVTRVNVTYKVNTKSAKKEKRNGRDVIIIPSATMPDNIVMNGIMYPGDEIAKSFLTLNRSPAPLGHPVVNGKYVSAKDPEGLNVGWIGAWNENVRRENGRVFLDKIVDVERANSSEGGKRVLNAIDKGEPIHTSTGLIADLQEVSDKNYKWVASNLDFDHDAILLDYDGAATPKDGVGIFVNAKGEQEEIKVINSYAEQQDDQMNWAIDSIVQTLEKQERAPLVERIKTAIKEAFSGKAETTTNQKDDDMSKEIDDVSAKVDALTESMSKIGDTIATAVGAAVTNALKPLVDAHNADAEKQKQKDEAEKSELVTKVVAANMLTEDQAKGTALETLRSLVSNIKTENSAAPIASRFNANRVAKSVTDGFKAPKAEVK